MPCLGPGFTGEKDQQGARLDHAEVLESVGKMSNVSRHNEIRFRLQCALHDFVVVRIGGHLRELGRALISRRDMEIESSRLSDPPHLFHNRRPWRKLSKVIFDAHNDRLRFAASINHQAFVIVTNTLEDLAQLSTRGQRRQNVCNKFRFRSHVISVSKLIN